MHFKINKSTFLIKKCVDTAISDLLKNVCALSSLLKYLGVVRNRSAKSMLVLCLSTSDVFKASGKTNSNLKTGKLQFKILQPLRRCNCLWRFPLQQYQSAHYSALVRWHEMSLICSYLKINRLQNLNLIEMLRFSTQGNNYIHVPQLCIPKHFWNLGRHVYALQRRVLFELLTLMIRESLQRLFFFWQNVCIA